MAVVSGFFLCSATTEKVKHMKKQIFGQSFRHQPLSSHVWQTSGGRQTSSSCQTSCTGGLGTGETSRTRGERTKGSPFSVLSLCMWSVCKLCGNFQLDNFGQEQLMPRMLKHSLKSGLFAQSFHSWMAARFLGANSVCQALGETPGNLNKAQGNYLWPWWQREHIMPDRSTGERTGALQCSLTFLHTHPKPAWRKSCCVQSQAGILSG